MFSPFRVRLPIPRVNVVKRGMLKPHVPAKPRPHRKHRRTVARSL